MRQAPGGKRQTQELQRPPGVKRERRKEEEKRELHVYYVHLTVSIFFRPRIFQKFYFV